MTSSNATADTARVGDGSAEQHPEARDTTPVTSSPFQLLPTGDAFGVCGLDGECR